MEMKSPAAPAPWWKYGHVWLVISGPAVVAVAGAITVWLAVVYKDPLVADDYYRRAPNASKIAQPLDKSLAPAQQGRNHAATPPPGPAR